MYFPLAEWPLFSNQACLKGFLLSLIRNAFRLPSTIRLNTITAPKWLKSLQTFWSSKLSTGKSSKKAASDLGDGSKSMGFASGSAWANFGNLSEACLRLAFRSWLGFSGWLALTVMTGFSDWTVGTAGTSEKLRHPRGNKWPSIGSTGLHFIKIDKYI